MLHTDPLIAERMKKIEEMKLLGVSAYAKKRFPRTHSTKQPSVW